MDETHYDSAETQEVEAREQGLFARLPQAIKRAKKACSGWSNHLSAIDVGEVCSRAELAQLPLLRKADLLEAQKNAAPFGGFVAEGGAGLPRYFLSPGPIAEPQGLGSDPWNSARALYAIGVRASDVVHNTFAYHMTPGGFILDYGARALGASVIPAGTAGIDLQLAAIERYAPDTYTGTPDYLKILLEKAEEAGAPLRCFKKALVSGGALYPSLREYYREKGIDVYQCYATADLGVIAYESRGGEGLIVNEDMIVEIVRPGTGEPVAEGDVGEVVVSVFNGAYPLIRFATGDLSAVMTGSSPCGRSNMRLKGWMGRADQRTKVKGMFVDPAQIEQVRQDMGLTGRLRLVVKREEQRDVMVLQAEVESADSDLADALADAMQKRTGLRGKVELHGVGELANDGKVISDERALEEPA
ncbi:phenylacetate--CoA ligase family protein [Polycladidibacter hongkongensis]|uniref:phenylacetate--CoA ligase family protein n=1 Tax=Polycladidibacter hongkongensis TaxID=1647556 RepID=UPI000829E975|nr:AMP-binding protein [Pseudovibrio hongkongensis]